MRAADAPGLTLAAIVPASDNPPTLPRCVSALEASERLPDVLIVQRQPGGVGPAAVRNAAVAETNAEILVFVDSDVEVHPDALARIERRFRDDAELDALFGAYDDEPAAPGLVSRFRNLLHHHVHVLAAGDAETFWAGLGAVRRQKFLAAGGFDEDAFSEASVEDIELGTRLRQMGARIELDPSIRGRHLKAWTVASMVKTDFARRGIPWARLVLRGQGSATTLNLGWRHRASAAASLLLAAGVLARRPRFALAGLASVLALNHRLYGLLHRRGGTPLLLAGVGLHVVHQLTAVAALPAAVALHLRDWGRG
ncbi:MAG TPA: glycosyltransferase [Solirubrobacterales bacterium]|nr:glycosyltransferase [Solirubrobacterales bacterium]